ncbi:MAG TPA: ATP-binding protein [Candidatus Acidoferrales bacterium]|nr:ATP-binding protein [Candidatus Acidoferrales bacterium]
MEYVFNAGLLTSVFLEGSAAFILLVLYCLLAPGFHTRFFRFWLAGWAVYVALEGLSLASILRHGSWNPLLGFPISLVMAALLFTSILECTGQEKRLKYLLPWGVIAASACIALEFIPKLSIAALWGQSWIESLLYLSAGWILWRMRSLHRGSGWNLLAGALLLGGLHGFDRPDWPAQPFFLLRVSVHGLFLITAGIAMSVLVLEAGRSRNENLNEKLRRLSLITAKATQSFRVDDALDGILRHLVESLSARHASVFLFDELSSSNFLVLRASVGLGERSLKRSARIPSSEAWTQRVLQRETPFITDGSGGTSTLRQQMGSEKFATEILVRVPGKEAPLGLLSIGFSTPRTFESDEEHFLVNIANLLGLTVQNVALFESAAASRRQWRDTFDSIEDLILVHASDGRILRTNRAFAERVQVEPAQMVGKYVRDVLRRGAANWIRCPYCEGVAGKPEEIDPCFGRYFLVTDSTLHGSEDGKLGTIHVLKDLTSKRLAESKFRDLFETAQEGVFIGDLEGHLLDCNTALTRIYGYESKEELIRVYTPARFYVDMKDRRRLDSLLEEYGEVSDLEVQFRRRDGEIRTAHVSAVVTRDESGKAIGYQGFLLDITERKQAEMEIRRRNQELLALNAIGELLNQSSKLGEGLIRALKNVTELFGVDIAAVYFLDESERVLRPSASVGCQSEYARCAPVIEVPVALLDQVLQVHATLLSGSAPALPEAFRELQRSEGILASQVAVLWAKDRIMGTLLIGCREMREFSTVELNMLAAVGNQIGTTIDKSLLLEETREAYDSLRRTQEQLLQSEKMAAVGQLIAGVAHELNNPLTAILGYSQLLQSDESTSPRSADYLEKLYKQAQRTHRIVQNLLSFARQHKPERTPVQLNQILEDTLVLREYDIKLAKIHVHREFDPHLPLTGGDFHQLQQVFLNILNNAVDAVGEIEGAGEIWIRTRQVGSRLRVEFRNNGPDVQNPHRIFDPFYTTKPVGKGTGLGLSICYGIIKEHGGEIQVKNSPPRGATFTVCLPLTPIGVLPRAKEPTSAPDGAAAQILLVENEEAVLQVEQEILRAHGASVRTARSAWEAIDILERQSVDAAVLDMNIPGEISTLGLYRWIEQNRPELAQRVIFTASGADDPEGAELLRTCGCPLLTKPFQVEDFWSAVQRVLTAQVAAVLKP